MNITRTATIGAIALSVTIGGCDSGHKAEENEAVRVKAIRVETSPDASGKSYSGTVEESAGVALSFSAAGTIKQLLVNAGDRVAAGQLIGTLDASTLQNTYEIASATLAQAEDAYARMKQLHDANALPDMQWVEAENALKQAQSAAAIAKKGLSDARLYAPTSGYVSEKLAEAGTNVAPGIPVVKIVNINPVKVNISVGENSISEIRGPMTARISVGALGGKEYTGRLSEKGVTASPLSRTYEVKFEVKNDGGELLPGMICDVTLERDSTAEVIELPLSAVLLDSDNSNFVWLNEKGRAKKRIVETGAMTPTGVIVKSGLAPGDSVITEGLQKVSEGTKVETING